MLRVCTWNVFHGRTEPAVRADALPTFAAALEQRDWDVCALQELPPWWARPLGERLGASVRVARTSLLRTALPGLQRAVHSRDPEVIGVRGAGVNALLVRPSAGRVTAHRTATLRWLPQRRAVHGVRLGHPNCGAVWIANTHTHNRPPAAAAADLADALDALNGWSAGDPGAPAILLGDVNLPADAAADVASSAGFTLLAGHRVDHILARSAGATDAFALRMQADGRMLADHRLVGATLALGS